MNTYETLKTFCLKAYREVFLTGPTKLLRKRDSGRQLQGEHRRYLTVKYITLHPPGTEYKPESGHRPAGGDSGRQEFIYPSRHNRIFYGPSHIDSEFLNFWSFLNSDSDQKS